MGRLNLIRFNQSKLRSDEYIHHLRDAISTDGNVANIGRLTILSATHDGSPRMMHSIANCNWIKTMIEMSWLKESKNVPKKEPNCTPSSSFV